MSGTANQKSASNIREDSIETQDQHELLSWHLLAKAKRIYILIYFNQKKRIVAASLHFWSVCEEYLMDKLLSQGSSREEKSLLRTVDHIFVIIVFSHMLIALLIQYCCDLPGLCHYQIKTRLGSINKFNQYCEYIFCEFITEL